MERKISKTLFGNYKKSSADEYISNLEHSYEEQIRAHRKEIKQLKDELDSVKRQEQEIGEAIVHAKMLIAQSREEAKKQAEDILTNAHQEYSEVQNAMLSEIDKLTMKRNEAEKIYLARVAEIRQALDAVVFEDAQLTALKESQQESYRQQSKTVREQDDL